MAAVPLPQKQGRAAEILSNLCDNQQLFIHPPQQSLDEPLPFPDQPLVLLLGLVWGTRDEPFLSGSSFAPQAAEFGADQEMTPSSPGTSGWGPQLCVREG